MIVEQLFGAVVGKRFIGNGPRGRVRCARTDVSTTIPRALERYVRLESTPPEIGTWVRAVGIDGIEVYL